MHELNSPLAGLTATVVGTLFGVPSLRVKGLYLSIATLAAHPILTWVVEHLVPKLTGAKLEVVVQSAAGATAGFLDTSYLEKGVRIESEVLDRADIVLKVQPPTLDEIGRLKEGATLIGFLAPYGGVEPIKELLA